MARIEAAKTEAQVPRGVLHLAQECDWDRVHSLQVTCLARKLFQELHELHELPPEALDLLGWAAVLHDIGLCRGAKGHNKSSFQIILENPPPDLTHRQAAMVALIARYHRSGGPSLRHEPYANLPADDRMWVDCLCAILRVADGLDRTHGCVVADVEATVEPGAVHLTAEATGSAEPELQAALKKADVFEQVFRVELDITTRSTRP